MLIYTFILGFQADVLLLLIFACQTFILIASLSIQPLPWRNRRDHATTYHRYQRTALLTLTDGKFAYFYICPQGQTPKGQVSVWNTRPNTLDSALFPLLYMFPGHICNSPLSSGLLLEHRQSQRFHQHQVFHVLHLPLVA